MVELTLKKQQQQLSRIVLSTIYSPVKGNPKLNFFRPYFSVNVNSQVDPFTKTFFVSQWYLHGKNKA